MCTDHQRSAPAGPATITSIPLARIVRPARWSRRQVLLNTGLGTAGVAILAACGSDSSGSDTTAAPATDAPPATEVPEVDVGEEVDGSVDTEAPVEEVADEATTASDGELLLQHVSLGFVSAYVLVRGREAAVVDTGTAGSGEAIGAALTDVGLAPADVRHIILTHNHGDHVGGLGELEAEMTNATVYAGPGDIDTIQTSLMLTGVDDGDEIFGLGVVGTPGHTPGSISVFDTETGLVVAGDAINGDGAGGITGPNPDFTPDMTTAEASVGVLAALMPSVAAFGHGGPPVGDDVTAKLAALAG